MSGNIMDAIVAGNEIPHLKANGKTAPGVFGGQPKPVQRTDHSCTKCGEPTKAGHRHYPKGKLVCDTCFLGRRDYSAWYGLPAPYARPWKACPFAHRYDALITALLERPPQDHEPDTEPVQPTLRLVPMHLHSEPQTAWGRAFALAHNAAPDDPDLRALIEHGAPPMATPVLALAA